MPVKRKKTSKRKSKKRLRLRILKYILILSFFLVTIVAGFIYSVYRGLWGKLPDYTELRNLRNNEASELYSEDGVLMGSYYIENRKNIRFDHIPKHTIDALLATEDVRFYEHKGFDRISMLRVIFKTLLLGDRSSGGGSTISQQLAKNLYPREEQQVTFMPIVKIKENIIAHRLENSYSKPEILSLYLNTVSFGERTFGIESAAQRFFSISASELTVSQSAVLIGMLKGPSRYNPRVYPERSLNRRNTVINQMVKYDFISEEAGELCKDEALSLQYKLMTHYTGIAPYLREKIRGKAAEIIDRYNSAQQTSYNLYKDGLIITTTIDAEMQEYAEKAVATHMHALQEQFYADPGSHEPWREHIEILDRAVKNHPVYVSLKKQGWAEERIMEEMNRKKEMTVYCHKGEAVRHFSSIDSIKYYLTILHPGMLAVEPGSGKIKVWIGDLDYKYFQYDQVIASRQAGSVFKPVIYSSALNQGASPGAYYKNEQRSYPEYNGWTPRNSDNDYSGYYTMKGALSKSINTISVEVLLQTGIEKTIVHAQDLGISSHLPQLPSLALGVAEIPLYEMIRPYMVFAGNGRLAKTYCIKEIRDKSGNILYRHEEEAGQVVGQNIAHVMTDILADVIDEGTGRRLRQVYGLGMELAGKTGTTQNNADGWFIGYHPRLVVGVRVGANDMRIHFNSSAQGQGAHMALPIFGLFMKKCLQSNTYAYWEELSFPIAPSYRKAFEKPAMIDSIKWPVHDTLLRIKASPKPKVKEKRSIFRSIGNLFRKM